MGMFEEKMLDLMRKGDEEKVKWMKSLNKTIMGSQIKRIQQNDKSVLRELVVPKWVTWDLLYDWAQGKQIAKGRRCILCAEAYESGIDFNEKFICENCFIKLKNLR